MLGRIGVEISDELEEKIRKYIADNYWKKPKGKLSKIVEEALRDWLKKRGLE